MMKISLFKDDYDRDEFIGKLIDIRLYYNLDLLPCYFYPFDPITKTAGWHVFYHFE